LEYQIPTQFSLSQNYPNPFNPTTTIGYTVPSSSVISNPLAGERSQRPNNNEISPSLPAGRQGIPSVVNENFHSLQNVQLKIYDVLGKEIATLVNETKKPGTYQVTFNASNLASGIYYYRLTNGNFTETKKLILLK
jgi:hypothetical protein